jgi:flagellar motor switch/type III secretory pathway protein FliN
VTASVREWLPLDIVDQAVIRTALAGAVEAWSEHWFQRHRLVVGSIVAAPRGATSADSGWSWTLFGQAVAINRSSNSPTPFASWVLDGGWDPLLASAADRLIVEDLEATLLADLSGRIEAKLGLVGAASAIADEISDPLGADGGAIVGLKSESGAGALRLAIPLAALVAFRKSRLPNRSVATERLGSRSDALDATSVQLDAQLGDAQLALADLQTLAVGDVLVLNTRLDGLAALTVEGAARPLARARVSHTEGQLTLTLQA